MDGNGASATPTLIFFNKLLIAKKNTPFIPNWPNSFCLNRLHLISKFFSVAVLWNYQFSWRKPCVFRQDAVSRPPDTTDTDLDHEMVELGTPFESRFLLTSGKGRFSSQVWHAWYQKKELVAEGSPLNNQSFCPMVSDFFDSIWFLLHSFRGCEWIDPSFFG